MIRQIKRRQHLPGSSIRALEAPDPLEDGSHPGITETDGYEGGMRLQLIQVGTFLSSPSNN